MSHLKYCPEHCDRFSIQFENVIRHRFRWFDLKVADVESNHQLVWCRWDSVLVEEPEKHLLIRLRWGWGACGQVLAVFLHGSFDSWSRPRKLGGWRITYSLWLKEARCRANIAKWSSHRHLVPLRSRRTLANVEQADEGWESLLESLYYLIWLILQSPTPLARQFELSFALLPLRGLGYYGRHHHLTLVRVWLHSAFEVLALKVVAGAFLEHAMDSLWLSRQHHQSLIPPLCRSRDRGLLQLTAGSPSFF